MKIIVWLLTVSLFTGTGSEVIEQTKFNDLETCIEQSRQRVREYQLAGATSGDITASCVPVDQ